jgi:hypothetical protein
MAGQRQNATKDQLLQKLKRTSTLKELKKKWILRRTKEIIANQLPNKGFYNLKIHLYFYSFRFKH